MAEEITTATVDMDEVISRLKQEFTGCPRTCGDDGEWQETVAWDYDTDSGLLIRFLPAEGDTPETFKGEQWLNGDIVNTKYDSDPQVVLAWLQEAAT